MLQTTNTIPGTKRTGTLRRAHTLCFRSYNVASHLVVVIASRPPTFPPLLLLRISRNVINNNAAAAAAAAAAADVINTPLVSSDDG